MGDLVMFNLPEMFPDTLTRGPEWLTDISPDSDTADSDEPMAAPDYAEEL